MCIYIHLVSSWIFLNPCKGSTIYAITFVSIFISVFHIGNLWREVILRLLQLILCFEHYCQTIPSIKVLEVTQIMLRCRLFGNPPLKQPSFLAYPVLLGDHPLLQGSLELRTQGLPSLVLPAGDCHSEVVPAVYSGSVAHLIPSMLENLVKLHLQLLGISWSPQPHEASPTHALSRNQMTVRWHDWQGAAGHCSWWTSQKELLIDGCFVVHSATFGTYWSSCRS